MSLERVPARMLQGSRFVSCAASQPLRATRVATSLMEAWAFAMTALEESSILSLSIAPDTCLCACPAVKTVAAKIDTIVGTAPSFPKNILNRKAVPTHDL